jgi:hypothetical protein
LIQSFRSPHLPALTRGVTLCGEKKETNTQRKVAVTRSPQPGALHALDPQIRLDGDLRVLGRLKIRTTFWRGKLSSKIALDIGLARSNRLTTPVRIGDSDPDVHDAQHMDYETDSRHAIHHAFTSHL